MFNNTHLIGIKVENNVIVEENVIISILMLCTIPKHYC